MSEQARSLLFRADAHVSIGTGHVMRCLALAQAWHDTAGQAVFVTASDSAALDARLRAERCRFQPLAAVPGSAEDAQQTIATAREFQAQWVVLDGYHLEDRYQRSLRAAGLSLLAFDDYVHARHQAAQVILNQNPHAEAAAYNSAGRATRLLLGARYVLLRREFQRWRTWQRDIPPVARRVLVTLGGSDPANVTLAVIDALRRSAIPGLHARVLIGASNPHASQLTEAARNCPALELLSNVADVPALMAWADLAVGAGGTTCWEMAFMGLPFVLLVLADNQRGNGAALEQAGVAVEVRAAAAELPQRLGQTLTSLAHDPRRRSHMAAAGRTLIDGQGVYRVLEAIRGTTP